MSSVAAGKQQKRTWWKTMEAADSRHADCDGEPDVVEDLITMNTLVLGSLNSCGT